VDNGILTVGDPVRVTAPGAIYQGRVGQIIGEVPEIDWYCVEIIQPLATIEVWYAACEIDQFDRP
jgi:hypothetical protein